MIDRKLLQKEANKVNVELSESELEKFDIYAQTLTEWNSFMNLTAIKEPDDIVKKHFADSLSLLGKINIPEGASIIDVGTGAGFPGLPILIARPDIKMTLLDSTRKRLDFIEEVLKRTGLSAETVHSRGEDAGRMEEYREKYDFATARAVANLRELSEYCLPFVKKGGYFVPMKSRDAQVEEREARKAIAVLGGKTEEIISFELSDVGVRTIFAIKKISQTPTQYPRPSAKIAKFPLK